MKLDSFLAFVTTGLTSLRRLADILHDSTWLRSFRKKLLRWYAEHSRSLPWRDTNDPYKIWVSEIMLQQTQVATVIEYYHRFIERFPTPQTLAEAEEQEVLSYWAGLGYYRRAKQLHKAAKVITNEFAGRFPTEFDDILALPGIGRYTAGAVASFAYGQRQPILEANTIRLHARLLEIREPTQATDVQNRLWDFADALLPSRGDVSTLNQAVMELGSLVCIPKNPRCLCCPVADLCPTFAQGLQERIPAPKPKKQITPLEHGTIILRNNRRVLVRQNQPGEWWEGLWDFPRARIELDSELIQEKPVAGSKTSRRLDQGIVDLVGEKTCSALQREFNLTCEVTEFLRTLKHGVTRYSITLYCFEGLLTSNSLPKSRSWKWVTTKELENIPLTSTAAQLAKSI